ncbi:NAD(P)/FAD-dependent oxidoreductase [Candidatus Woesearchaeota archaeon]|nr:NAD(P)/FAD-dependent oxidoreductase [Candidatus Woesearchaeota archaeon]
MKDNYDVIIVGGGFAGLGVAAELAKSRLKILLIEKNKRLGINANPVRGTFKDMIKKYKFDKALVQCYEKIYFYGTENKAEIKINNNACLFDSQKLLNILKKRIKCKLLVNCEIINARRENNKIILVDSNKKEYTGNIIVDASGENSVVAQSLGIEKSKVFCACYIAMLDNCKFDPKTVYYLSSDKIANAAAWFEPVSKKKGQIGIADFEPYTLSSIEDARRRALNIINNFKPAKEIVGNAKILKSSEKMIYYPAEPINSMILDNLIVIGDAAGQATPLLGEGVRVCLDMTKEAADVIKAAFKKNDFSKNFLDKYEERWWKMFGKYSVWGILLRHFIAKDFKDKEWNIIIENLNNLNKKEKEKFIRSELTYSILKKLLSFEVTKDIFEKIVKDHFSHLNIFNKRKFVSYFV